MEFCWESEYAYAWKYSATNLKPAELPTKNRRVLHTWLCLGPQQMGVELETTLVLGSKNLNIVYVDVVQYSNTCPIVFHTS